MNKIDQLTKEIEELEEQAGTIEDTNYEALYSVLVTAYFKAKDIIELQKDLNPVIDEELTLELSNTKDICNVMKNTIKDNEQTIQNLSEDKQALITQNLEFTNKLSAITELL